MASEIVLFWDGQRLTPAHPMDREVMDGIPAGRYLTCTIKQKRSLKQARFYWALLRHVVRATGRWPTEKQLHTAIKMELGYIEPIAKLDGTVTFIETSTAFGAMDAREFRAYLDAAIDLIFTTILAGVPRGPILNEVSRMCGVDLGEEEDGDASII